MFFSISPDEYAESLMDELYGCFKYIGIPYDTLMNMPIQNRKYFISRHNKDCEELDRKHKGSNSMTLTGEATKEFTEMSMADYKRLKH